MERQYREENGVIYCDRRGCPGSKGLRCYRTGVPICTKCSVRTPVGYLSKDAAREQSNLYFNAGSLDYVLAGGTAFFLSMIAGFFISMLPFFLVFFIAVPVGGVIGEAVFQVTRKRRGRYTAQVVGAAMSLSVLVLLLVTFNLFSLLIYAVMAVGTATARVQVGLRV